MVVGDQTFDSVDLYDMFMNRILKVWLLPSYTYLPSTDFFQSDFGRGWYIETKLVHENLVRSLADLIGTVKKPVQRYLLEITHHTLPAGVNLPYQRP